MLKPSSLSYYMSEERKEKKGSIVLDKHCCVEVQPRPHSAWGQQTLHTPGREGDPRTYDFTSMSMGEPVLWLKPGG